jgi:hypothetical protein
MENDQIWCRLATTEDLSQITSNNQHQQYPIDSIWPFREILCNRSQG